MKASPKGRAFHPARAITLLAITLPAIASLALRAAAQPIVPTGFADELVAGGFDEPTNFAFLPDGPQGIRLLAVERTTGWVREVNGGTLLAQPVLKVDSARTGYGEQGLLGIAIDPGWPTKPYLYLQWCSSNSRHIKIARWSCSEDGAGNVTVDSDSRYLLFADLPDAQDIHNGGTLRFGPDGYLYSSLGDDGFSCDAQNLAAMRGKILRLDVSGLPPGPGGPASPATLTPASNPFVAHPNPLARLVWLYGLRNPWSFHIDPANGDLLIADVGELRYEELDWAPAAGMNFGWPYWEGPYRSAVTCAGADTSAFVVPIAWYVNPPTGPAAVVSGSVYRRPASAPRGFPPEYEGNYFYEDVYGSFVRRLEHVRGSWAPAAPVPGQPNATDWSNHFWVSTFLVGPDGALWYSKLWTVYPQPTGQIRRIAYTSTTDAPVADASGLAFLPPRPSPASSQVILAFRLPEPARVSIVLYDAGGRAVRRLLGPERRPAGPHESLWDGRDEQGRPARAGIYFAHLVVDRQIVTRRVALLR